MTLSTVTWRQVVAAVAATVVGLFAIIVVVRADGLAAVDAASARATGWFVHQPTGRVVLVDGYRGTALGSIDAGTPFDQITVAEGATGAYVLNDTTAEAREIDTVGLRLRTPFGLTTLGDGRALSRVGQAGLVVVNPDENAANLVAADGDSLSFDVETGVDTEIAPDGAVWSIVGDDLVRTTSRSTIVTVLGVPDAALSLVGSEPLVVDAANRRARLGTGRWHSLPTDVDPSEIAVQAPGPSSTCGWVGANDDLWCVGRDRIEESAIIPGIDIDGSDLLGIAGDAAVLVRRGTSSIVRFDWRAGVMHEDPLASVPSDAALQLTVTTDLVWVDDPAGDTVWAVNPWSIEAIEKDAPGILVLGENGEVLDEADPSDVADGSDDRAPLAPEEREPDNNGIDDPPIAVDDSVTARSGASVTVEVTANDYDPDGEAVAVAAIGVPGHGSVDIGTASTVVYTPDPGYVGIDRFEYTIVDGNGSPASATVIVELLAPGTPNRPPVGVVDEIETGPGVPITVDVLLNDVDPERDSLRIASFSPPDGVGASAIGEVTETIGAAELPALRFDPLDGFEGTATFTYRPMDSLGAIGDDVEVRVEVARSDTANRPPVTRPDAVRLRRDVVTSLAVLANDTDPDGDPLTLTLVEPLPTGLDVEVRGQDLTITARAGAQPLSPFEYAVDDGRGHVVHGSVLVGVIDEIEPNRPPVVTADNAKVVVGQSVIIDVTANDVDPDGDPLTVIDVEEEDDTAGPAVVFSRSAVQFTPNPLVDDEAPATARLSYTVSDGSGHEVVGEVTVTVLPEALAEPPFARDDSTFTFVDVPVTIDVLRNDVDPSGGRPRFVGRPGCPAGGVATITTDSQIRFDPPLGRAGAFRCTYEVTNASGRNASASIIVSVREPEMRNQPPIVVNDTLSVEIGASASIDVTANDRDPDGDNSALRVVSSTAPNLGTAQRNGNVITFVAGRETGVTLINYRVSDADGSVSLGRLNVRVTELANRPPIAVGDAQTIVGPGTPQQFSVLANDSDPDETPGGLSVVSAARVSGDGTVSLTGNVVTITPEPDLVGQVVATYTIRDGLGLTANASIVLTVQEPLNRPPEAQDDSNVVENGGTVSTAVLFNDTDPDGDALTMTITSGPDGALGTASVGANGSVNFTAVPGAAGTASMGYQITDGELTDDAVLRITVLPCAQSAPVAKNASLATGYQQPIAIDLGAYGSNGTIVDVSGPVGFGGGVYTPPAGENGNVTINYSVVNACRLRASGRVTIDVNQEPVGRPTTVALLRGGQPRVLLASELASDAETLSISGSSGAPSWVSTEAGRLVVAPGAGVSAGDYSWTTTVADPGGLSTTVAITARVASKPTIANPDVIDATQGRPTALDVVANDVDPNEPPTPLTIRNGPPAQITFTNGAVGTVVVLPDLRSIHVDPGDGLGSATFTYTVQNVAGDVSAPATVTVNAPPLNTAPYANDQGIAVGAGEFRQVVLDVGDPDGDAITIELQSDPSGIVTELSGTTLTVRPMTAGTHTVTYRVRDDGGAYSAVATVTVTASAASTTTSAPTSTSTPSL